MSVINIGLRSYFNSDLPLDGARWEHLGAFISRRLSKAAEELEDRCLHFEAGECAELSGAFARFVMKDGSATGFADLWMALEDFCGGSVTFQGRSKTIYRLPPLPDAFGC